MMSRSLGMLLSSLLFTLLSLKGQSSDSTLLNLHLDLQTAPDTAQRRPLSRLALYHIEQANFDSCRHYGRQLLQYSLVNNDMKARKNGYWYLGRASLFENKYEEATQYLTRTLELSVQEADTTAALNASNSLGLSLRRQGKIKASISVFQQSLEWAVLKQDTYLQTIISINLGSSYRTIEADKLGAKYYEEARQLAAAKHDSLSLAQISINQGNYYTSQEQYDSSRFHYQQAERYFLALGNQPQLGLVYANLANVDLKEQRFESALAYCEKVLLEMDTVDHFSDAVIVSLINSYEAYYGMGDYLKSLTYLQQAEDIALEEGEVLFLEEIYELKSRLYETWEDYPKAFRYMKKHLAIKDSLFNQTTVAESVSLENQSELSKQERMIDNLEKSSEEQQLQYQTLRTWLVFFGLALLALLVVLYIYSLRQKQQRLLISQQAAENKLEALRNQINPHFLFNSFNAVQHYILRSDQQKAYSYLTEFAHLLRLILDNAPKMTIQLAEELSILKAYVHLEALRFQDKFQYEFILPDELLENNPRIPSMIIQPYIENAILHGISNRSNGGGLLKVHFSQVENQEHAYLQCVVEDNGIGRAKAQQIKAEKEKHQHHRSIAMNNTSRRLEILEKAGYRRSRVEVEDLFTKEEASGTRVILQLPFL